MPSGGLIAMGNVGNLMRDLRAGLLPLVASQRRFLRRVRGSYDVAVAVGDVYALAMTLRARSSTVFVGTAKSVSVARYGAFEERMLARAKACFVRDEATAQTLRRHGLSVEPGANVIVDLFAPDDDPAVEAATAGFATTLALFPGSRVSAYDDAVFLLQVLREIAGSRPEIGAMLSIARGLDAGRFAADAQRAGWEVSRASGDRIPFSPVSYTHLSTSQQLSNIFATSTSSANGVTGNVGRRLSDYTILSLSVTGEKIKYDTTCLLYTSRCV